MNPVDEYFELKKQAASKRREEDIQLVTEWQRQHQLGQVDPTLQEAVFNRFEPVRRAAVSRYKAPLTPAGFDTKSRTLMAEALRSWSPTGGAAPSTHITNHMRRLYRENLQQQAVQNTEADAGLFGHMDTAKSELMDELGRSPMPHEVVQRMNERLPAKRRIDLPRFQQLESRRGGTALSSSFESNPISYQSQVAQQNLDLLPYDLNQQERQVYNHLYGRGGQKSTTSTNTIAKRMGVSAPTISRLRKSIAMKAGVTEDQLSLSKKPRKPKL